jgi:shikimate kinase
MASACFFYVANMNTNKSNIVLIGMPGAGKSTIGVMLAKKLSLDFVDTDIAIQKREGRSLQDIVDRDGYLVLRRIEEEVIIAVSGTNQVIATGGSAVYSDKAMQHLKSGGRVVFLQVSMDTLKRRVHDYETRGLAKRPDQTLDDLFAERSALYQRYADITIVCDKLTHEQVCEKIVEELKR